MAAPSIPDLQRRLLRLRSPQELERRCCTPAVCKKILLYIIKSKRLLILSNVTSFQGHSLTHTFLASHPPCTVPQICRLLYVRQTVIPWYPRFSIFYEEAFFKQTSQSSSLMIPPGTFKAPANSYLVAACPRPDRRHPKRQHPL